MGHLLFCKFFPEKTLGPESLSGCHSREGGNSENKSFDWIPAFAGMTKHRFSKICQVLRAKTDLHPIRINQFLLEIQFLGRYSHYLWFS